MRPFSCHALRSRGLAQAYAGNQGRQDLGASRAVSVSAGHGIPTSTRVSMLVGSDDQTTPPSLTNAYATALWDRGIPVDVTVAPGLHHNILLAPEAMEQLKQITRATGAAQ